MRKGIIIVTLAVFLIGFTWSVKQKEQQMENGEMVIVALAPRDPRALLLGDYMALNFAINSDIDKALSEKYLDGKNARWRTQDSSIRKKLPRDGIVVVRLDANSLAEFVRLEDNQNPGSLAANERRVYFRVHGGSAKIAADSFFFQEGFAEAFEEGRFGELRVDADGKNLLVHLLDKNMKRIQPENTPVKENAASEDNSTQ